MKTTSLVDFNPLNAFQSAKMPNGFKTEEMKALTSKLAAYQKELEILLDDLPALRKRNLAWLKVFDLPEVDVKKMQSVAQDLRKNFKDVVVLGIGGSDFGPRALFDLFLGAEDYNNLYPGRRGGDDKSAPNLHFFQSFDSRKCCNFLRREGLDLTQTAFIVISKSGKTLETRRNFEFFRKKLKEVLSNKGSKEDSHKDHFVLITDVGMDSEGTPKSVLLQQFWRNQKSTARAVFPVPDGVGGRFSVFSPVGLLPAAVVGIDIETLVKGLKLGLQQSQLEVNNSDNHPVQLAALQYMALCQGRTIHYFYAFGEVFKNLTKWYEQLVEESIGKQGIKMITKPTVGTIDNHSFVQNLLGGDPTNKFVIFLAAQDVARDEDVSGDDGIHFDDNLLATLEGTRQAVTEVGIPNVTLTLPKIGEKELGQLMFLLEVSVAYLGEALLGLDGKTFLQPDVEKYKVKTAEALKKLS